MDTTAETRAWAPNPDVDGDWLEAVVVSRGEDGTVVLKTVANGDEHTCPADKLNLMNVLPEQGVEDMARLNYLHEPALLNNLRHRFALDHVYTYTAKICIAVNPFDWQVSKPLYGEEVLRKYRGREMSELPPHVYAIAEDAYQKILDAEARNGNNQSVLVSGESGAGKTEAVKIMMNYLAAVSRAGDTNLIAQQVLASNPLLEAFGNAKTSRNNNSSRFGKFIEIQFDQAHKMSGAHIHIYLLEKSRIAGQAQGERNYHVFYQLLAGMPAAELAALHLDAPLESFGLVNQSGCVSIPGQDEAAEFARTRTAMGAVGLSEAEQRDTTRAVAAVLLLAQLAFEPDDEAHATLGGEALQRAATLLGAEAGEVSAALCTRQLVTRDDIITVPLSIEQAVDSRDALGKALYARLFEWLVQRCNAKLVDTHEPYAFIGILDIFGFECFVTNSFEQLCINYANERLQQQFNWDIFKSEQIEYEREGIEWKSIEFVDNQECLDLIDSKPMMGLLTLLDEECAIQSGSDAKFVQKAREMHKAHAYFDAPKRHQESFSVRHYAGEVTYASAGFREKNKDTLHPDLSAVMRTSSSAFVASLFAEAAPPAAPAEGGGAKGGGAGGGGKKKAKGSKADKATVGAQFITQLSSLMATINSTGVHYVRCIKPNTQNLPAKFEMVHTAHQLRCAGVLEAIRVSRMAYPNRMPHASFVKRYALLASGKWLEDHASGIGECRTALAGDAGACATCTSLLSAVLDDAKRFQLGKTKVFFRAHVLEGLEQRRGAVLAARAVTLQKNIRMAIHRRRLAVLRWAATRLQSAQRKHRAYVWFVANRAAAVRVQAAERALRARRRVTALRRTVRATAIQAAARGRQARRRARRLRAARRLQAAARRRAWRQRFVRHKRAALRLQARRRMTVQRRQYLVELAERKEESKLSTQLARIQAQLQAEIEARQAAEQAAAAAKAAGIAEGQQAAAAGAGAAAGGAAGGEGDAGLLGAAASAMSSMLGYGGGGGGGGDSSMMAETNAMLMQVTKDRENYRRRLEEETKARKKFEAAYRELHTKTNLNQATSQLETRKNRDINDTLSRRKEEIAELNRMMQHQTIEISNLQADKAKLEKRVAAYEKKLSQYDDSFYALEARNVRDRTRMEEMGKAKNKAESEKNVFKHMLEQAHERWLRERQELFRDALNKVEANASRVREQQTRISQLEIQMRNQAQLEEEIKMYKEQARSLAEQSALAGGDRGGRRASTPGGGGTPRATTPRATSTPGRSREPAAAAASPAPVAEGGTGLFGGLGAKMQAAQAAASKRASGLITQGASLVNEYAAQPPAAAPDQ